jgi:K+-transporting ATPase KdpF subunit
VAGPDLSVSDILELILAVGMLVYLVYVLIRPEKF